MKDGIKLKQKVWDEDERTLRRRAAYDMHCGADQLEVTVLARGPGSYFASNVGIRGCGAQAVYVRMPSGSWAVNTNSASEAPDASQTSPAPAEPTTRAP